MRRELVGLLVVGALALGACGGDDGGSASTADTGDVSTTAVDDTDTSAADTTPAEEETAFECETALPTADLSAAFGGPLTFDHQANYPSTECFYKSGGPSFALSVSVWDWSTVRDAVDQFEKQFKSDDYELRDLTGVGDQAAVCLEGFGCTHGDAGAVVGTHDVYLSSETIEAGSTQYDTLLPAVLALLQDDLR